jgi:hypothetical protein
MFVEIQIRTYLQHRWAEIVEALERLWGRQIRYGDPPTNPDHRETPEGPTRQETYDFVMQLAIEVETLEMMRIQLDDMEDRFPRSSDRDEDDENEVENLRRDVAEAEQRLRYLLDALARVLRQQPLG